MAWLVASLRRLRQGRAALAGIAALVFVTSFLAAAGPRLFDEIAQHSIHDALADIPPADRVVQLTRLDGAGASARTATSVDLDGLDKDGEDLKASFPAPIPELLGPTSLVIETPSFRAVSGASLAAELRLRIMPGAADHIRIVSGRAPTGVLGSAPDPLHSGGVDGAEPRTIDKLEAVISRTAAMKLGLSVGSVVVMVADLTLDPQAAGSAIAVTIVGTYDATGTDDPFWVDDSRVLGYTLREYSANVTFIQSTLLLAPEALGPLVGSGESGNNGFVSFGPPPRRVTWRYPADPSRLGPDTLSSSIAALRRLQTIYSNGSRPGGNGITLDSRLLGRLVALQGPWDAAAAVLGVAAVGAAAVALAAMGLVIALTADERRRVLVLQRERGASSVQSIVAVLVEGAIGAVPAGLVGAGIAVALVPGPDALPAIAIGLVVAAAAIGLELALVIRSIVGPPRQPGRVSAVVRSVRPRRLVFEVLIVGLAAVGAVMLRDRGLQVASAAAGPGAAGTVPPGADPFLAIVPVIVGVAAALVALRVAPLPIAGFAALAARGRGIASVLAARRAARGTSASRVLLIVLAIATLGSFASATVLHLRRTAELQSWQDVGGDVRIDAGPDPLAGVVVLPDAFDPARLAGVDASAAAHVQQVGLSSGGQRDLIAVDAASLQQVLRGTPVASEVADDLAAAPGTGGGAGDGTDAAPLPAVISTRAAGPYPLNVGDVVHISLSSQPVSFRVVAAIDRFPGIPDTTSFVVASWPQINAVAPHRVQGTTSLYLRLRPGTSVDDLSSSVRATAPTAVVSVQAADEARLQDQPVVSVLSGGVVALAVIALVYAALAVVAAFVLAAAVRALETAQLATLGLGNRVAGLMLLIEYGPPVALATIGGAALGLGLFAFLAPGLGFGTIVGVLQTAPPSLDPAQIGVLAATVAVILAIGVALGAPAQRRAAGAAARRGVA